MSAHFASKSLKDVCEIDKEQGFHSGLPYVGLEDIESGAAKFLGDLTPQSVKSATFRFSSAHVLYGRLRPYLNKVLVPDFAGHCSTEIFPLKPTSKLLREFLCYWLRSEETVQRINETSTGARMPRAEMNKVMEFALPVPPLAEQRRIVGILDEAFAGLEVMRANAEANLENARALLASYLDSHFPERDIAKAKNRLAQLCQRGRVITYGVIKLGDETPEGVPCLRTSNVRPLRIEEDGIKRISARLSNEYTRTILKGGELLVNVRGTLGGVAVAECRMVGWNVSREVAVVPVDLTRVRPQFLAYMIAASSSQRWLTGVQKGAAYVGINIEDLREFPVFLPDLKTQDRVCSQVGEYRELTMALERNFVTKLSALDELRKSLLHQAFSGNL